MITWFGPSPAGNRSSTDEGRTDNDDDTQVMEPDQGNGKSQLHHILGGGGGNGLALLGFVIQRAGYSLRSV